MDLRQRAALVFSNSVGEVNGGSRGFRVVVASDSDLVDEGLFGQRDRPAQVTSRRVS